MKIKHQQSKKYVRVVIVIAGVAILTSAIVWAWVTLNNKPSSPNSQGSSIDQKSEPDEKQASIDSDKSSVETPIPEENNVSVDTTREADGSLTIIAKLKNVSDGTCELTVNNESTIKSYTAPVIFQPEYSSCAGFNLQSNEWNYDSKVSLRITSNGTSITKTVLMD